MFSNKFFKLFYQANADGGDNSSGGEDQNNDKQDGKGAPASFASFDEFYNSLSVENQKLVAPAKEHFDKVYSSVKETRKERDTFSTQLKDLRKQLDGNADAQKKVDELSASLDNQTKRADFYEEALTKECRNPKAAFALAVASDLFTKNGTPDWKAIREQAPELFGQKVTKKSNAGSGTEGETTKTGSFNDWIRQQAGINVSE